MLKNIDRLDFNWKELFLRIGLIEIVNRKWKVSKLGKWFLEHPNYLNHHANNLYPAWEKLKDGKIAFKTSHSIGLDSYIKGLAEIGPSEFPFAKDLCNPVFITDVGTGSGHASKLFHDIFPKF